MSKQHLSHDHCHSHASLGKRTCSVTSFLSSLWSAAFVVARALGSVGLPLAGWGPAVGPRGEGGRVWPRMPSRGRAMGSRNPENGFLPSPNTLVAGGPALILDSICEPQSRAWGWEEPCASSVCRTVSAQPLTIPRCYLHPSPTAQFHPICLLL